ncbi:MAG: DUF3604 domain-containing protein [Oceanospirillaceae bacterium]|nr:DUF3604 domain-containing protein [Oceanospirillaceae bacterium]
MKTRLTALTLLIAVTFTAYTASEPNNEASEQPPAASKLSVSQLKQLEESLSSNPLKNAYFGETHMHTGLSLDALFGMTATGPRVPDDAYRFAKGETIEISGYKHKLSRPLDFAAVTDHAEYIGESYSTITPGAPGYDSKELTDLRAALTFKQQMTWYGSFSENQRSAAGPTHPSYYAGPKTTQSAWQMAIDAVNDHYQPGTFTTLAAYEWTAVVGGGNQHRNVFFRDMILPLQPFSAIESTDETKLWAWMAEQEENGSTVFAIPHNSNASKGLMFPSTYPDGRPIDEAYLRLRNKYERSVEIMQIKGNSEVLAQFWPNDEMAGFENAPSMVNYAERKPMKNNFVRWGVIEGLKYQMQYGINPFQLGFNGGTDSHNGAMSDVAEDDFIGGHGPADNTVEKRRTEEVPAWLMARDENPGSITGVWAEKNTRGQIWDAMYNRETFVTSGPRIQVRIFAGQQLKDTHQDVVEMVKEGYANGVPMGGTITAAQTAPVFNVWAAKDANGANLDRIQIIKGWVDLNGEHHEKIIEVVWSGDRILDSKGKLASVGNSVDLKTAFYTNTIGDSTLMGSFTDQEFDPSLATLYYARVLEIPTPRWSTYDAVRNNLPLLTDVAATIQERAWSSPIWFYPK